MYIQLKMLNNQILGLIHQELSNDNLKNVKKLSTILHPSSKFCNMDLDNSQEKILFEKANYNLKKTSIENLILLIQNDIFNKDETPMQEKIIKFLVNDEIKSYQDVSLMQLGDLEIDFECKKLEWQDFNYIKYKYKNKCHDGFANGDLSIDYGQEEVEIIYKIGNNVHSVYLDLGYKCHVDRQHGEIEEYHVEVLNFNSSFRTKEGIKQDIMIASRIICTVSKLAVHHEGNSDFFYDRIARNVKLD